MVEKKKKTPKKEVRKSLVLVIDDMPENLYLSEQLITRKIENCDVITTEDPDEALEWAASKCIDLILLDRIMPKMSGIELCQRLKKNKKSRDIPVVMVTGFDSDPEQRVECLDAGALDFIKKPIDTAEFIARLKLLLRLKHTEDDLKNAEKRLKKRT